MKSAASINSNADSNVYETIGDVPQRPSNQSKPIEPDSPNSPEQDQGIYQTVMGARIERDDTIKQRPSDVQNRGLGFKLPVKKERHDSSDDHYDKIPFDEAEEIIPKQSGLSQTQILANMMKEKEKEKQRKASSGQLSRQAAMDNNLSIEEKPDSASIPPQNQEQPYPLQPQQRHQYSGQPQQPGHQYPGQPQQPGQQYPGQPQQPGQQYPGQPQQPGQQYPGQPQQPGQPGQLQPGQQYPGHQQPHQHIPHKVRPTNRAPPKETCIDDDLPIPKENRH